LSTIHQLLYRFQQHNEKAFCLALLRVAFCIWYIVELSFRWPAMEVLYHADSMLQVSQTNWLAIFHLNYVALKPYALWLNMALMVLLWLHLFGIGRNAVALLIFLLITLIHNLNNKFFNSGENMIALLSFYLSFANTYEYFVIGKRKPFSIPEKEKIYNLLSNLAAYCIAINLCMVYFLSGLFKLGDMHWLKGTALHYFINDERYSVFAFGYRQVNWSPVIVGVLNYGTILLELVFPLAVFYKPTRKWVLLLAGLMHLGIFSFLMVFAMSVCFVMQYPIFFTDEELQVGYQKIKCKLFFWKMNR
jgi:hypothetical protein